MKKITTAFTVLLLAVPLFAAASKPEVPERIFEAENTISNELWLTDARVRFSASADEDLFLFCTDSLMLDGKVSGDLWGFAGKAEISGTVESDLRLATQRELLISGMVEGNVLAISATTVKISSNAVIKGSLRCYAPNLILNGEIENNIEFQGRSASLNGRSGGNALIRAPELLIGTDAEIDGELAYENMNEVFPAKGSRIGSLRRIPPPTHGKLLQKRAVRQGYFFLAAILGATPLILFFPGYAAASVEQLRRTPWRCMLTGYLVLFGLPLTCSLLLASLVGLPLAALLAAGWGALFYCSKYIVAFTLALLLFRRKSIPPKGRQLPLLLSGLVLLYLPTILPELAFIWTAVIPFGMGALVLGLSQRITLIVRPAPDEILHEPPEKEKYESDPR